MKEGRVEKMDSLIKRKKFIIDTVYFVIVVGLFYLFMKYAFGILIPFILAMFVAMLLQHPVNKITEKTRIPRGITSTVLVLMVIFVFGSVIALVLAKVFGEIKGFFNFLIIKLEDIPLFIAQIEEWITDHLAFLPQKLNDGLSTSVTNFLEKLFGLSAQAGTEISGAANSGFDFSALSSPLGAIWGTAKQIPQVFVATLVGIVCCCFMTSDFATLRSMIMTQAGEKAKTISRTKEIIFSTLGKMGKAYGIIIFVTFSELAIGLTILKIFGIYESGYIFAISIITAIIDIVPVLGTGTVLVPWAIWSLCTGNIGLGIGILVIYAVITVIRQIIEPKLLASQFGLPAFITLFAMYIGSQLFGVIGLFLMPLTVMLLKVLNDEGVIHIFKKAPDAVKKPNESGADNGADKSDEKAEKTKKQKKKSIFKK